SIFENILIFRKPGRRKVSKETKEKSKLTKKDWMEWTRGVWFIEPDRKAKHPATFPLDIPERLIKLYSFVGDVVYDPFAGTGTTLIASWIHGRNSIGVEINPEFLEEFKQKWNTFRTLF
ncbi:MAG: site-specific DNA-methyltransferase, partial [Candidatus Kryptonium sp.]